VSVPESKKPVIEFNSLLHPSEITGIAITLDIIDTLLEGSRNDPQVAHRLKNYRFLIIPVMNPDGFHYVRHGDIHQNDNAFSRKNMLIGVNLNRNFPFAWDKADPAELATDNPYSRSYRGPSAGSEPETLAYMKLIRRMVPLASISYHSEGENLIYPSAKNDTNVAKGIFLDLGRSATRNITTDAGVKGGFNVGTASQLYQFSPGGSSIDWSWQELSVFAFVCELIDIKGSERPDRDFIRDLVKRQAPGWKGFVDRLGKSGFKGRIIPVSDAKSIAVHYRILNQNTPPDDPLKQKTFPLRNRDGLFYSVVEPGRYVVSFESNGRVIHETPVTVSDTLIDFGDIHIDDI
jgi:carboxypeptidase T